MLASAVASLSMMTVAPMPDLSKDWRNGAIVYQVFVDRFAPSANLEAKRSLYPAPARLRPWSETPKGTAYDPKIRTYPHVMEFWGGDLASLQSKLDYVSDLGADVIYPLPIFKAPSNHKYDTEDYFAVDPQYGNQDDLKRLIKDVHGRKMRVMLDGVFNHIGVTSAVFQDAQKDINSKYRDWFYFGKEYEFGYRGWAGVASLPALKLENPAVQDYLWERSDSVVRKYLKEGIDGWRLDVAFELGPKLLTDLTRAAHKEKKGSAVIGEISGYPANWFPAVDGTFNFTSINTGLEMLNGRIGGGQAGRIYHHMVEDAGLENLLKSWILFENHDTPRMASLVKDVQDRNLLATLQMTLPGSPCIYYGAELGMEGTGDPENRAPMRWDLVTETNGQYQWMRKMIGIRKKHPALRYGQFTALDSDRLLAFSRTTDKLRDSVLVVMNPTDKVVRESFPTRIGRLMSWGELQDQVSGQRVRSVTGMLALELKPKSVMILTPVTDKFGGYSPYDRID